MSTTIQRPDVAEYVAQVRAELNDLDGDVLEELVGGLDADLADVAAESPEPLAVRLGSPTAYAAELRAAAGVPDRTGQRDNQPRPNPLRRTVNDVFTVVQGQTWWPGARDFLQVIRPVWWLARAYIAVQLLGWLIGSSGVLRLVVMAVAVVVSVELGRGRWGQRRGLAPLVLTGNILAVLAIPTLLPLGAFISDNSEDYVQSDPPPGLSQNGQQVLNVFPYDSQGRLLSGVQLFDQDGRPLEVAAPDYRNFTTAPDGTPAGTWPVPALDAANQPAWYVFPLRESRLQISDENGEPEPFGTPTPAVPRALSVPAVRATDSVSPTTVPTPLLKPTPLTTSPTSAPR